jgi:DNA-binding PadR family transcriptional regulator
MTAVFSHGRLRLYLLKLLAEGPKHGYELIRLLENRFLGLYAPSAGTIYPRLQRMEAEGLVTHTAAGGRKVYEITEAGRAELRQRADELADLETEIHASVADLTTLAGEIEQQVSGSVRDIKRELREAAQQARSPGRPPWPSPGRQPWPSGGGRPPWASGTGRGPWPAPGQGAPEQPGHAGQGPGQQGQAVADLERAVGQLAGEVRRMARQSGVGEAELRAATAVVGSALTELRRLLRG